MTCVFQLPAATAYVRSSSEKDARQILRKYCYPGAPVDSWPCLGYRAEGASITVAARVMAEHDEILRRLND